MGYPFEFDRDHASAGRGSVANFALAVVGTFAFAAALSGAASYMQGETEPPQIARPEVTYSGDRQVIAVGQGMRQNRCIVRGFANGVAVPFEIDTGDPNNADFPSSYTRKLGIAGPLDYSEWWPGTRYGKVATATLRDIRIADVTWRNPEVNVYSDWDYSFGDDEIPLLGLGALKAAGVNVEFEGDRCRLTVSNRPGMHHRRRVN